MLRKSKFENPLDTIKTGRIDEACARYGLGRNTMRRVAADAGAVIRIGTCVLFNFTKLDAYFDSISLGGKNA